MKEKLELAVQLTVFTHALRRHTAVIMLLSLPEDIRRIHGNTQRACNS